MTGVRVTHGIGRLAADMASIPPRAVKDMRATVREGIKVGNSLAKDFARQSSGTHARLYPREFTTSMNRALTFGGVNIFSGEYGPEARGQGLLAPILENGSRNNKPHFNLTRSADMTGPAFAGEVRRLPDKWFW
jgi:hypothetical protein